jgi:hypothetical protein
MKLYKKINKSIYIRNGVIYRGSDAISAKEESEAEKQVDELKASLENIVDNDLNDQNSSLLHFANNGNGGNGGDDGNKNNIFRVIYLKVTQVVLFFLTSILTLLHNHFIVKRISRDSIMTSAIM